MLGTVTLISFLRLDVCDNAITVYYKFVREYIICFISATQTSSTSSLSKSCSMTSYGINDIWPFFISMVDPLDIEGVLAAPCSKGWITYSGSFTGGHSTRAWANTARLRSGLETVKETISVTDVDEPL